MKRKLTQFREWLARVILGYDFVSKSTYDSLIDLIIENDGNTIQVLRENLIDVIVKNKFMISDEDY